MLIVMYWTVKMYTYVFCLGKLFLSDNDYNACKLTWDNREYIMGKLNERE